MPKTFIALVFLIACKTDNSTTAPAANQPAAPSSGPARSAKIDPPAQRPELPQAADGSGSGDDRRGRWEERRKERMTKLDTDGDGQVSDEEREAARDARQKSMLDRFDKNKDGKIDETERAEIRHERTLEMQKRLDRDGDGKLTVDELKQSRFARIGVDADADHDGIVTTEELDAAMKARGDRFGRRGSDSE
jgi:Ca2+-binding EF-hand superfamily protein